MAEGNQEDLFSPGGGADKIPTYEDIFTTGKESGRSTVESVGGDSSTGGVPYTSSATISLFSSESISSDPTMDELLLPGVLPDLHGSGDLFGTDDHSQLASGITSSMASSSASDETSQVNNLYSAVH